MRNEVLDILILGLLVVLFFSINRKRSTRRLRFWINGWLCVLLHFAALLVNPPSAAGQNAVASLSISALAVAGLLFLASASLSGPRSDSGPAPDRDQGPATTSAASTRPIAAVMALGILACVCLLIFTPASTALLLLAAGVAETAAFALLWRHRGRRRWAIRAVTASSLACAVWLGYAIAHHDTGAGLCAILAQLFFACAGVCRLDFKRNSAGVFTTVLGLLAWGAVFPAAAACTALWPALNIPGELWNLPKFFVAFGMILTLLEDELILAGETHDHYRLLFAANPHPMWIYEPESLRFLTVNDAAVEHYGYAREEFLRMTLLDLRLPEDRPALLRETVRAGRSNTLSGPWRHVKKDGTLIQVDIASHTIPFGGRDCRFVLVQDVTERQRLHEQLVHQANHDALTGLPNRLLIEDRMQQIFSQATRHGQCAAVLCIDLDRFKQVNDTYGHPTGDLCLQHVAARLRSRLRAVDTVARTGGEEFTIVLGELEDPALAGAVAMGLLDALREPIQTGSCTLEISGSVGIAIFPNHGTDITRLWTLADLAMYRAKSGGGNRYCFVSPELTTAATDDFEIDRTLRALLRDDAFILRYQPQYSAGVDLCGLEARLVFDHPSLGVVTPERYLPIAERSDLVLTLGQAMLQRTCRDALAWRSLGLDPQRIAMRISPLQFIRSDFAAWAVQELAAHSLPPSLFEFQVSEAAVMRGHPEIARQMRALANCGVRFSVDDFGTGYSSISHLHQLPITTLRIDRSFIERVTNVHGTYSLVHAIISLAHSLGLQVLAEGIDTAEQVALLRELRCDILQGMFFSAPLRAEFIPGLFGADSNLLQLGVREPDPASADPLHPTPISLAQKRRAQRSPGPARALGLRPTAE